MGLPAAAGPILWRRDAARAAKAPKNVVDYQDQPKGDERCSACRHFVPADDGGPGSCKLVEGDITGSGWCMLFEPES